jgi:hypothetical protein
MPQGLLGPNLACQASRSAHANGQLQRAHGAGWHGVAMASSPSVANSAVAERWGIPDFS